ncbi:MAG: LysR family transcriptional regulator [Lachnospiraceae bacterium]|nr:LysR family transcriptional regulator [Lachnospiraceae bacterium]
MNRNQLKYFIAAAESQSFSKAAEQFYISQTAITQQIQTLEAGLECKLFNRNTRPVSLTPAGRAFLTEAKAIVERMERAQERVHEASEGLAGSVRIGYVRGYERSNLSNVMREFHVHHENVLLTYYRDYSDALAAGLLKDEYDIIFTWDSTNLALEKSIEHVPYEKSRLVAVLYASHPFARRESLTRADLKSEDLIFASHSSAQDSYGDAVFMNLYKAAGYRPNIVARVTDIESALMMVATEEGITIMPQFCTAKISNADNLVFVPMEGENEEEEIIAAWKKDNTNPALGLLLKRLIP